MMMFKKVLSISATCVFLLAGCGGGSSNDETAGETNTDNGNTDNGEGSSSENTNVLTGVFVDSAVEGASYSTETRSGVTNSLGEFSYLAGETVTFSIGPLVFPSVPAAEQVSPVDMASGASDPSATTTNIARLLQSLDQDGNPENGIKIPTTAADSYPALNFDVPTAEFENNAEVLNLVANSGSDNMVLISAEVANAHLNNTLGTTTEVNNDGFWLRNPASETESNVANYSLVDGLNVTRYNGERTSDGNACYSLSTNSLTPLGDDRYQLNADNGPLFYTIARVGETLEVTADGEATLIYPRVTDIDPATLPLCENSSPAGTGDTGGSFSVNDLISGTPWYSVRVGADFVECANKYTFGSNDSVQVESLDRDGTTFGSATVSYSLTPNGVLTLTRTDGESFEWTLTSLSQNQWVGNRAGANDLGPYTESAFALRSDALAFATNNGVDCSAALAQ